MLLAILFAAAAASNHPATAAGRPTGSDAVSAHQAGTPPPSVRAIAQSGKPDAPLPLFAVDSPDLVAALGSLRVEVGAWAEYLLRSRKGTARIRFSLLSPKLEGGRYWLEVAAFSDMGLPFALRALLRPGPVTAANVERATVYVLGQAPLEVPVDDLKEQVSQTSPGSSRARISRRPEQTVSTLAGRFKTTELHIAAKRQITRVWRSDDVPLWGLVRAKGPEETIELVAFSREGAQSAVPGPSSVGPGAVP